jgi:hypothetical protein
MTSELSGNADGRGRSNRFARSGRIVQKRVPASAPGGRGMHDSIERVSCGIHEKFIASEHVDDILFDMMDEIVPFHVARWRKLRTLGHNEKHNRMSEKLVSL